MEINFKAHYWNIKKTVVNTSSFKTFVLKSSDFTEILEAFYTFFGTQIPFVKHRRLLADLSVFLVTDFGEIIEYDDFEGESLRKYDVFSLFYEYRQFLNKEEFFKGGKC